MRRRGEAGDESDEDGDDDDSDIDVGKDQRAIKRTRIS